LILLRFPLHPGIGHSAKDDDLRGSAESKESCAYAVQRPVAHISESDTSRRSSSLTVRE
jgi:hypothetical protein